MKKLISISLVLLISVFCFSAEEKDDFKAIQTAIKLGNATSLTQYFDEFVLIKTDTKEGKFSKQESSSIMKHFFETHKPTDFVYDHQGSTPNGVKYAIATYSTKSETFNVYMKLNVFNETELRIKTLDFTKE